MNFGGEGEKIGFKTAKANRGGVNFIKMVPNMVQTCEPNQMSQRCLTCQLGQHCMTLANKETTSIDNLQTPRTILPCWGSK